MNPETQIVTHLKDLVIAYQEAKDKLKQIDDEYKKSIEPLKEAKTYFQAEIIKSFKESQQLSARFPEVTATLAKKKTAKVIDAKETITHLKSVGLTQYISESLNEEFDGVLKQIAESGDLLPGIVINETEYLTTRSTNK